MAQSAVEICNVALSTYLGAGRITSMHEQRPESEACDLHYDRVRRSLLESWPWTWASARAPLTRHAVNDRPSWAFKYAAPTDMIAIRWVNTVEGGRAALAQGLSQDTPRELTGDAIYSDVPGAVIDYTRDVTDPTLFPPGFGDAFAAALAAAIGMTITADGAKVRYAEAKAAELLERAKVQDFNRGPSADRNDLPPALAAREGTDGIVAPAPLSAVFGTEQVGVVDYASIYDEASE